jgi:hypothetical protein
MQTSLLVRLNYHRVHARYIVSPNLQVECQVDRRPPPCLSPGTGEQLSPPGQRKPRGSTITGVNCRDLRSTG